MVITPEVLRLLLWLLSRGLVSLAHLVMVSHLWLLKYPWVAPGLFIFAAVVAAEIAPRSAVVRATRPANGSLS